jgi:cyclopropane fatty-acyl-phospholipid synthase-like methyltransferase
MHLSNMAIITGNWEDIFSSEGVTWHGVQEDVPKIAHILKHVRANKILDLGCGTGRHTIYLAKKGFNVYGFDMSVTGIRYTKRRLKAKGLKAHISVHDMSAGIPYRSGFFDALISIQVIDHNTAKGLRSTINEIYRVLRKGGTLFVSVQSKRALAGNKHRFLSKYTYIPLDGGEKGLLHHYFTAGTLRSAFKNFDIKDVHLDSYGQLCILATKP